MYQKHASKLLSLTLCLGFVLFSQFRAHGQRSLGVPEVWVYNPAPPFQSQNPAMRSTQLIGNHPILCADSVISAFERILDLPEAGHSIFLVLRPKYRNIIGKRYLSFKGLEITDSEILYRGIGREFIPDKYRPLILSASFPAKEFRGGRSRLGFIDTNLFAVAEIIAYNRFFSKEEMRLLESYLSLKYSIPTTKNENKGLRAYPGDSSSNYYWTPKQGKVYDREVVALGNFSFSGLQQTQTVAYHDDSLIAALDSIVPLGQMPPALINEGSFLVLSKRIDQSSTYDCELHLNQQFPITAWRLRTKNFQSTADSLRLLYPNHHSQAFGDTIILTDGWDTININWQLGASDLSLAVPLGALKANRVYRFRVLGNACDDTASIMLSQDAPGLVSLNVKEERLPLHLKIAALHEGLWLDTIMLNSPMQMQLSGGQYQLWAEDENGELQSDFLVAGADSLEPQIRFVSYERALDLEDDLGQKIVMYPNPSFSGEETIFRFLGFEATESLMVEVFDRQGRMIHREKIRLVGGPQEWLYKPGIPGAYHFAFNQGANRYSQKLIVKKPF
jgi:hypothetical protein